MNSQADNGLADKNGRLFTPQQAARFKKVSRTAIYSAIARGRLTATSVLGRLAIKEADLAAWTPVRYAGRKKGFVPSEATRSRMAEARRRWWKEKSGRREKSGQPGK